MNRSIFLQSIKNFIIHRHSKSQINQLFPKEYNRSTKIFFYIGTVSSWSQCNSKARLRPVLLISSQLATHSIFHYEKRREKKSRERRRKRAGVFGACSRAVVPHSHPSSRGNPHTSTMVSAIPGPRGVPGLPRGPAEPVATRKVPASPRFARGTPGQIRDIRL